MSQTISAAVGLGGANRNTDVKTVQKLLNNVPVLKGGPYPKLVVDGLCGPKTVGAIRDFQQSNTGFPDGRVDPGGPTVQKLNTYDKPAPTGGGSTVPGVGPPAVPPNLGELRSTIVRIAREFATPAPGKVSDLVTMPEPGTGRTVRAGWQTLKDFFDVAVAGWQESYWKNPDYINGVKIPGRRIPQPGRDGISWCGIFATYVLIKAGLPVKWVLGKGITPLPIVADKNFKPGDVLVMSGSTVHHCIAVSDDGSTMATVNGNSDNQSILFKPQSKSQVAYYYRVGV